MTEQNQRKEYWDTVRAIAQDIKEEWQADNDIEVSDRVWENVDGNQFIIYYARNLTVLQCSDNSDSIDDQGIELDTSKGWQNILTQVAFYAMLADVQDQLSAIGWNGCDAFEKEEKEEN